MELGARFSNTRHLLRCSKIKYSGFSLHFLVVDFYSSTDGFYGTCFLVRRAYQINLTSVDLQIFFGTFSCQQGLFPIFKFYETLDQNHLIINETSHQKINGNLLG